MKKLTTLLVIIYMGLLGLFLFLQNGFTEIALPEGAKARLGKGYKTGSSIFADDGTRFAVSSSIGLWVYDVFTGQEVALLTNHPSGFTVLAVSPDGNMLASANENTIYLWEMQTGRNVVNLAEHSENITTLVFSPDSKILASASRDNTIRLWDATTGKLLFLPMSEHTGDVISIAFSPDSTMLASGSTDRTVRLWSATTGKHLSTLEEQIEWGTVTHEGHTGDVTTVAFSPDGTILASGDTHYTVRLWDVSTRKHQTALNGHHGTVNTLTFSMDGSMLVSGSADNTIRLWNPSAEKHLDTLEGHEYDVITLAFSKDGTTLASGDTSDVVRLWEGTTGQHLDTISLSNEVSGNPIRSVTFSPDGLTLASGHEHPSISIPYQYRTSGRCPGWFYYRNSTVSTASGSIQIWDALTGEHSFTLTERSGAVNTIAFSPDGTILLSAGTERYVIENYCGLLDNVVRNYSPQLWQLDIRDVLFTLEGHSSIVTTAVFSHDSRVLASGGWDDTIRLWNAKTGHHLITFSGHNDSVNTIAFSPDGGTLASGSDDDTIKIWNSEGQVLETLYGHEGRVNSVDFSPDGKILASGSSDDTIRLWDPATAEHITTLEGHTDWVRSVAFSIDGGTLASGSDDGTIRLWDTATGQHLDTLNGHRGFVYSVAFSPNGTVLASGSRDGTILLWEIEPAVSQNPLDVNGDGVVDIVDLVAVVLKFDQTGKNAEDVNGDGVVNVDDVLLVAGEMKSTAAAPSMYPQLIETFTIENIQKWLTYAKQLKVKDVSVQKGIVILEQLLAILTQVEATPIKTALLPNYPNPFNPETWIPYQLAVPADVSISIHAASGKLVRKLDLGHQPIGIYQSKNRAVYWDGKNEQGEPVASGVYFNTLTAGDFSATRKMLIRK